MGTLLDDSASNISWWARVDSGSDIYIEWGDSQKYFPDFVAIDFEGTHWLIETKADSQVEAQDVQEKKKAAERWQRHVNDSSETEVEWRYLFVSESNLKVSTSWGSLLALST